MPHRQGKAFDKAQYNIPFEIIGKIDLFENDGRIIFLRIERLHKYRI